MLKHIPVLIQIALAPLTIVLFVSIFLIDKSTTISLLGGMSGFSAVFAALCYSACSSAKKGSNELWRFKMAAMYFFEASLLGCVALIINYALTNELFTVTVWFQSLMRFFYSATLGLVYGLGLGAAHFAIWYVTKAFYQVS